MTGLASTLVRHVEGNLSSAERYQQFVVTWMNEGFSVYYTINKGNLPTIHEMLVQDVFVFNNQIISCFKDINGSKRVKLSIFCF